MITRRALLLSAMGLAATAGLASCTVPRPPGARDPQASATDYPGRSATPVGPLAGIGAWEGAETSREIDHSGARWYYTWRPDNAGIEVPDDVEFVPMVASGADLGPESLAKIPSTASTLLTFNEPDVLAQANMSVEEMISVWPLVQDTGLRLGSPATSVFADREGELFHRFMTEIDARGYRVDFVAAHWYPLPGLGDTFSVAAAVDSLQAYLEGIYKLYGRPIWLTELSLVTWYATYSTVQPAEVQAEFLTAAVEMMRTLPYVERWAWFSLQPVRFALETAMYDDEAKATVVGNAFRAAA